MLNNETSRLLHVAKVLFLCKCEYPNIEAAVTFLFIRVKGPKMDDFKKLAWVMKYLGTTTTMLLTF